MSHYKSVPEQPALYTIDDDEPETIAVNPRDFGGKTDISREDLVDLFVAQGVDRKQAEKKAELEFEARAPNYGVWGANIPGPSDFDIGGRKHLTEASRIKQDEWTRAILVTQATYYPEGSAYGPRRHSSRSEKDRKYGTKYYPREAAYEHEPKYQASSSARPREEKEYGTKYYPGEAAYEHEPRRQPTSSARPREEREYGTKYYPGEYGPGYQSASEEFRDSQRRGSKTSGDGPRVRNVDREPSFSKSTKSSRYRSPSPPRRRDTHSERPERTYSRATREESKTSRARSPSPLPEYRTRSDSFYSDTESEERKRSDDRRSPSTKARTTRTYYQTADGYNVTVTADDGHGSFSPRHTESKHEPSIPRRSTSSRHRDPSPERHNFRRTQTESRYETTLPHRPSATRESRERDSADYRPRRR